MKPSFSEMQKAAKKKSPGPRSPAEGFREITCNNQIQLRDTVSSLLHRKQMLMLRIGYKTSSGFHNDKSKTRSETISGMEWRVLGDAQ